jgi:hypothetical protein
MKKIFNFIVLWHLIKTNDINEDAEFYNSKLRYFYCSYFYFDKSNKTTTLFKKTIYVSYINYEIRLVKAKKNYSFNLWNWQAKLLYKMAKNKYLKS